MGSFNESEHPRDKDGKFTDKGNIGNAKQRISNALDKLDKASKPTIKVKAKGEIKNPIYAKVLGNGLRSNQYVLTAKQEEHILQQHPQDYKRYGKYINEILNKPDAVFDGNKNNRLAIVKKIDNRVTVVLEVSTHTKKPNHVITMYKVNDVQYNSRLKKWKVLYKK